MGEKSDPEDQKRLKEAVQASHAAAVALTKDAAALSRQAAVLKARAAETRAASQAARSSGDSDCAPSPLLTIPEAARQLHVAERALRLILAEPDLHERLVERTRKVGIYYKFIPLLPTDLMADLSARLPDRKPPIHGMK